MLDKSVALNCSEWRLTDAEEKKERTWGTVAVPRRSKTCTVFLGVASQLTTGSSKTRSFIESVMGQLRWYSGRLSVSVMKCVVASLVVLSMTLVVIEAATTGGPIPAADLPNQCNSVEKCCVPKDYKGKEIYQFKFQSHLPMRTRRPAHLASKEYIAKIEKGYKILRELPDSDPRSLLNQNNLHCLYCDYALYYPGVKYPLAIHNGWFFLPWHRMFSYFHERILAKVLDDDTFALPYWEWDSSKDVTPAPNMMPAMYANPSSSLYDINRNNCSYPPNLADLETPGGCTNKTPDFIRIQNDRIQYTQLVTAAPSTELFYGMPYRLGDFGGAGPGTIEDNPHGPIHLWLGKPNPQSPLIPYDDMGHFHRAAFDPIFYPHHVNLDRLWSLWEKLPGGDRSPPSDPLWLDSAFTFYDEDANLVKINVSQVLDMEKLRYRYEKQRPTWVTNGVHKGKENSIALCNPLSKKAVESLIAKTPEHSSSDVLTTTPLTFKVPRGTRKSNGTEVLEITGLHIPNILGQMHWSAYLFFPGATGENSNPTCPEFFGTINYFPVVGQSTFNPTRVWRVAIRDKLVLIGKDYVDSIVVTLVPTAITPQNPAQNVTFESVRITYLS